MIKKQHFRWKLAAACRANAAGSTARNDAVKQVTHQFVMSDDISGEALARKWAVHYTGALYN